MKINRLLSIALIGTALTSTSCIDSKYDLSDIDTTSRINVNDLVVPINIDQITLESIIKPNNHIKIEDGVYAYVQSGGFSTGAIDVPNVTVKGPKPDVIAYNFPISLPQLTVGVTEPIARTIQIDPSTSAFSFTANDISSDICGLDKITGEGVMTVRINVYGLEGLKNTSYQFLNLTMALPEGLTVTDCENCYYNNLSQSLVVNTTTTEPVLTVRCKTKDLTLKPGQFNEANHSLTVNGNVGVRSGAFKFIINDAYVTAPKNISMKIQYTFSDIYVKAIDGTVKYDISDVNVPDINISDLPDVLSQPGTNLILANPCLYLNVSNPLYENGVKAQTGFKITAYHGEASKSYSIDNPYFEIGATKESNFCLSPKMPANPDSEFPGCKHVPFTSLSDVLSGDGLPSKLSVNLVNPCVPRQTIRGFKLGKGNGQVHGNYKFVAPLQFKGDTHITYSDKLDGWSSEDLDKMTITRLEVNLVISTDIPIAVDFTGYPIDKSGNRIQGVNIEGVMVSPNAHNQAVKIVVSGTVTDLDGLEFEAHAVAANDGNALSPDMSIKLTNIRPCVSGYYQTEL